MIRGGFTLSRERLTYDDRVPDVHDWIANEVNPYESWVVREYDRILFARRCNSVSERDLRYMVAESLWCDPDFDWHDFLLHAEDLTARILAQEETLPIAV